MNRNLALRKCCESAATCSRNGGDLVTKTDAREWLADAWKYHALRVCGQS